MDEWFDHARKELGPKMRSSAFVISIDPGDDIDPKIALETGYAVLLGKPVVVVVPAGVTPNAGLSRLATEIVTLHDKLDSVTGQMELQAAIERLTETIRG